LVIILLLNSVSYRLDTFGKLKATAGVTLHFYLNQDIKPTDKYNYEEAWSMVEQLKDDGLVRLLYS